MKRKKQGIAKKKVKTRTQRLLPGKSRNIAAQAPSQVELQNLIDKFQNGLYGDAENLAILLAQQFPSHAFSWKILGGIYNASGRMIDALAAGKKAVELGPEDNQAHNSLGAILYAIGRFEEAEASFKKAVLLKPSDFEGHFNLGNAMRTLVKFEGAATAYRQAIAEKPDYAEAHNNLGLTLVQLDRVEEAEASYRQASVSNPYYADAYYNLGNTLLGLDRLDEAEAAYKQAIELKPDFAGAHCNLGNTLKEQGKLKEAEASYRKTIAFEPGSAEAYSNLGFTLKELGKLEESEASCRHAIAIRSGYVEAHFNLGSTLKELQRLEGSEACFRKVLELEPEHAEAHSNLGMILYASGYTDCAIESLEKAYEIDSDVQHNELLLHVLRSRRTRSKTVGNIDAIRKHDAEIELSSSPLIQDRVAEAELISTLYEINSSSLDQAPGPRYGNGRCSPDYNLFNNDRCIIKNVKNDLISIMKLAVKSEIYVYDSFFNIYSAGSGIPPHSHLSKLDKDKFFNLGKQKYSLVYYLSVGDQDCSEPGILNFYDPEEEILPCNGMIAIFSAGRLHSAVYDGKKDRVMIGINFYSL